MKLLISNDDGVLAPGIQALSNELSTIGEIRVIAPDRNRSGASNSLTLSRPLSVRQLENSYFSVDGTPSDCVHLALTGFFDTEMDMVISGINDGANLGDDVLYSGTVAAAMEGRYLGLPALAISMAKKNNEVLHYRTGAVIAKQLILKLVRHQLPAQTILNVNVPDLPLSDIKGIVVTRLGTRHPAEPLVKQSDPRGRTVYWIGPPGLESDSGPGTDFFAIQQDCVSVTPLQLDMTHYNMFGQIAAWTEDIEWDV